MALTPKKKKKAARATTTIPTKAKTVAARAVHKKQKKKRKRPGQPTKHSKAIDVQAKLLASGLSNHQVGVALDMVSGKTKKYRTPKKGRPETIKKYAKKYYQEHKEQFKIRAIAREHIKKRLLCDLTLVEWAESLVYFDNKCAYCGISGVLQKEHIIPVARGGGFTKTNIVPACVACNQSKGSKPLHEWYKYTTIYSQKRLLKLIGWIYGKEARAEIEIRFSLSQQVS